MVRAGRAVAVSTPVSYTHLDVYKRQHKCIGCGRCFKVCPRDVLTIVQRALDDVDLDDDDDDDDDDDSDNSFMTLSNALDCIGCEACSRVCPKACFTHESLPVAA